MDKISINDGEYVFMFGKNYSYRRVQGAITFNVGINPVLPFSCEFDINPDGSINIREVYAKQTNHYICFAFDNGNAPKEKPTQDQIKCLAKMLYDNNAKVFPNFGSPPGSSVQRWAFNGMNIEDIEKLGNNGERGFYA